jgi:hypothetical protein
MRSQTPNASPQPLEAIVDQPGDEHGERAEHRGERAAGHQHHAEQCERLAVGRAVDQDGDRDADDKGRRQRDHQPGKEAVEERGPRHGLGEQEFVELPCPVPVDRPEDDRDQRDEQHDDVEEREQGAWPAPA